MISKNINIAWGEGDTFIDTIGNPTALECAGKLLSTSIDYLVKDGLTRHQALQSLIISLTEEVMKYY